MGASSNVSSRRQCSWPARKESNTAWSRAKTIPSSSDSEKWMWQELPSRSLNLAMKLIAIDSWAAISLAPVLVDRVLVGGPERVGVAEVDLVLAEIALALGVLHDEPGAGHRGADPADQRLDPRGAQQRVVDVVEVGRLQLSVALVPRRLVAVAEPRAARARSTRSRSSRAGPAARAGRAAPGAARRRRRSRPPSAGRTSPARSPPATGSAAACPCRGSARSLRSRSPHEDIA